MPYSVSRKMTDFNLYYLELSRTMQGVIKWNNLMKKKFTLLLDNLSCNS